ncbi:MAG: alanine--tRNA ligase-related protein, partial [Verrucomicrobiota bacterium]
LDPAIHIVNGNVKDNFWMMGDTGPCGPCSELHVDLTPNGDTQGKLVNADSDLCIEIWNLVFIQYNAEPDGTFRDLPAKHVDTGMGFERVVSILQNTNNFQDFSKKPTNYNTDVFQPYFRKLEELSGIDYTDIYPAQGSAGVPPASNPKQSQNPSGEAANSNCTLTNSQLTNSIAFRVIADHIRTLSLSIADGILPGNNGRNYVLRRILRRAVRYGRNLGFTGETPFLPQLVDTLVAQLGTVFPELPAKASTIKATLQREEESFNQTLDRGLQLFERVAHASSVSHSASCRMDSKNNQPQAANQNKSSGPRYTRRNLPHFERPWGKYLITFNTQDRRILSHEARQKVLNACQHFHNDRYILYAAVIMPDHAHLLIEPQPKELDADKKPVFWSLSELMHSIKSFTANEINKLENNTTPVWQKESHDRLIRSETDLREKYDYIILNPRGAELSDWEHYPFLYAQGWNPGDLEAQRKEMLAALDAASSLPQDAKDSTLEECATPPIFPPAEAFKLYDTYGFPLDLTALLCRERGLTLDEDAVEEHMEEQRNRARSAQKSETVAALDLKSDATTEFVGFDSDECEATILELHEVGDKLLAITDKTPFYAEMGGQQGDEGEMLHPASDAEYLVYGAQQIGNARGHLVPPQAQLKIGDPVTLRVFTERRRPIEAHHTATHLLHWALHEVVSSDATQQGSLVAPDRLRFDFSSAALTPEQLTAIEEKVNACITAAEPVSWQEVPHAEVKNNKDIMQFFGDKYGDLVRVVQIGGEPEALNGYSMELCGGTHVRNTSEIGQFIIKKEEAIASGVRRIEAAVGDAAQTYIENQLEQLQDELEETINKIELAIDELTILEVAHSFAIPPLSLPTDLNEAKQELKETKELAIEAAKASKKAQTAYAAKYADSILAELAESGKLTTNLVETFEGPANLLQELLNGLKKLHYTHAAFLIVDDGNKLHLGALCGEDGHNAGHGAGKLIGELAPLAGGKGGGKPDFARGAAPDLSKKEDILQAATTKLLG